MLPAHRGYRAENMRLEIASPCTELARAMIKIRIF